jgi:ABC-type branched-subunit amino acid transport system ATPase component
MTAALEVSHLSKRFGGIAAVDDCSFAVGEGTLTGLIGPNGSGKTSVLNLVSGYVKADAGTVRLFGRRLPATSPAAPYRLGLTRTFQRARIFPTITVRENLYAAVPQRRLSALRCGPGSEARDRAGQLLHRFGLAALADSSAGELSYGQQKLLEFATVLMSAPRVILLDEPTAGVNPVLIEIMTERIRDLHADGATVLVVEHNMDFVMSLCDPVIVLDRGRTLYEGPPAQVQASPLVLDAYLGD